MIVAERKDFGDILRMLDGAATVMVLGCRTCVAVCLAGGDREVSLLAAELRLKAQADGRALTVVERSIERQCDREFVEPLADDVAKVDVVLSLGCGCGVQNVVEILPSARVVPGLDTRMIGVSAGQGEWVERCAMCGRCMLDVTGGVCPVARCSKSLMNGPCGGSQDGVCEVDPSVECAWQLIYDRMRRLGRLEEMAAVTPPKDWSTARDGGPRKVVREEAKIQKKEQ
jgi:ferredoxin